MNDERRIGTDHLLNKNTLLAIGTTTIAQRVSKRRSEHQRLLATTADYVSRETQIELPAQSRVIACNPGGGELRVDCKEASQEI